MSLYLRVDFWKEQNKFSVNWWERQCLLTMQRFRIIMFISHCISVAFVLVIYLQVWDKGSYFTMNNIFHIDTIVSYNLHHIEVFTFDISYTLTRKVRKAHLKIKKNNGFCFAYATCLLNMKLINICTLNCRPCDSNILLITYKHTSHYKLLTLNLRSSVLLRRLIACQF